MVENTLKYFAGNNIIVKSKDTKTLRVKRYDENIDEIITEYILCEETYKMPSRGSAEYTLFKGINSKEEEYRLDLKIKTIKWEGYLYIIKLVKSDFIERIEKTEHKKLVNWKILDKIEC